MKYPILAQIKRAPGKGGKMSNRAFDARTGEDITRSIVYATLKNALDKGMYLYKENDNSSWVQVDSNSTLPEEVVEEVKNDCMAFLSTCVEKRPDTLFMEDLNWKFICRNVYRGRNMLLTGPTGTGKSQTAIAVAKALGRELFYVNLGATQDPRGTLIGNTHFSKDAGTFFNESAFVKAIKTPNTVVLLDEVSRAHPEAWNILMTVLDPGQRYIRLDEAVGSPTIKVAEGVSFVGTANLGAEYTAVRVMDRALLDRFTIAEIPYLTQEQETSLIQKIYPEIAVGDAQNLAEIATLTRQELSTDAPQITTMISTRSVIEMAGLMVDGFSLGEVAQVGIYPMYSDEGGLQSERTFVRQIVQKFISDGTDEELFTDQTQNEEVNF
jgi:Holliday junction resolvasome RuvABC ATP-dependent DNA helicase subunit